MITDFDKTRVAAHYKKTFAECIDCCDYERAVDYLLKYDSETPYKDIHLALGMLYLQMCLDSDDNELPCMAYREFMMHIRRFPDCRIAYRDMLMALLLKRDGEAFLMNCKWIKSRGIDFGSILNDLASCGVLFLSSEDDEPDFDELFAGEYGDIIDGETAEGSSAQNDACAVDRDETRKNAAAAKKSKIIPFAGSQDGRSDAGADTEKKIIKLNDDIFADDKFDFNLDIVDGEEGFSVEQDIRDEEFNDFISAYMQSDFGDGDVDGVAGTIEADGGIKIGDASGDETDKLIRAAEEAYDGGNGEIALKMLSNVERGDMRYYYALTMRALILMESERFEEAEQALDEAVAMRPDGALGGALLCQLYEYEKKYELIPPLLKSIDVGDYINSAHLYKSFYMALKYCNDADMAELIKSYIDEFNIMEMRLVYAQLLYNRGLRDTAIEEFYRLSRIFYDDINARYFYLWARAGADRFAVDVEVPQAVLSTVVEKFMAVMLCGDIPDEALTHEMFVYGMEFFLTLEFRNDRRFLVKMFEVVYNIARDPRLADKVRDELVSPYVEPIVKAVILGELLARDPEYKFLVEYSYFPFSYDCEKRLAAGYTEGYYRAYAFVASLYYEKLDDFLNGVDEYIFQSGTDERDKAYFLFRSVCSARSDDVDRVCCALGYKSKAEAERAYKALKQATQKSINIMGEI